MLRVLRIAGIVVFALVVGYAAHSLYKMYVSGRLFETYNSQRKSSITLLAFSVLALGSLGYFEIRGLGNASRSRRYGERRYTDEESSASSAGVSSCIYAVPKPVDDWHRRRNAVGKPPKHKPDPEMSKMWMKALRIVSTILTFVYIVIFSTLYLQEVGQELGKWVWPSLGISYVLVAAATAIGIYLKRLWGLSIGYLLSILNLVIFPVGTAVGLVLLVCLVGASSTFVPRASKARPRTRSFV